jgi:arabinan endo-1,5-alpha-L-arabinosidase
MKTGDIQIRDPFIVPLADKKLYVMYGTTDKNCWSGPGSGFNAFTSKNLEDWDGPHTVFKPSADFWGKENFWAPEVHRYRGRLFMFASFKAPDICRGTQVLVADDPLGPFIPHSKGAVTPRIWECLDGTLYVDKNETPWMIFCREWVQTVDGEMWAIEMEKDLSAPAGKPCKLFTASQAPWTGPFEANNRKGNYVTDGPFFYTCKDDSLLMMWSSYKNGAYRMGMAKSTHGMLGPWKHVAEPLFSDDGGHGMIFKTCDNKLMVTFHRPNNTPNERPQFIPVEEKDGILKLV